jgi:DNA adenine methylase
LLPPDLIQRPWRPFLKWPGGKFRLAAQIRALLPKGERLIEPFVGAGAIFLNTQYSSYQLNDINPDLINLFKRLKQHQQDFIDYAKSFFKPQYNQAKAYYTLRHTFNRSQDPLERAVLFLFLNRHGFNGLCRFNLHGEYNVPFGAYLKPYFPEAELHYFMQRIQSKVTFSCQSFSQVMANATRQVSKRSVVIYCDPPYAPLSKTANFTGYAAHKFTLAHQQELAQAAERAAKQGATVLISNHDLPFTRALYHRATLFPIAVNRLISCQAHSRKPVRELMALFLPDSQRRA